MLNGRTPNRSGGGLSVGRRSFRGIGLPGFYPAVAPPLHNETGVPLSDLTLLSRNPRGFMVRHAA